jgi:hypothetical protein
MTGEAHPPSAAGAAAPVEASDSDVAIRPEREPQPPHHEEDASSVSSVVSEDSSDVRRSSPPVNSLGTVANRFPGRCYQCQNCLKTENCGRCDGCDGASGRGLTCVERQCLRRGPGAVPAAARRAPRCGHCPSCYERCGDCDACLRSQSGDKSWKTGCRRRAPCMRRGKYRGSTQDPRL